MNTPSTLTDISFLAIVVLVAAFFAVAFRRTLPVVFRALAGAPSTSSDP